MTIYGQTLGVFNRENNERIRNGEKTNVVLWLVFRHELRHYDIIMTYPIEMGLHCKHYFTITKVPVPFWTLLFKFFVLLLKYVSFNLRHRTFKKSQKYLYRSKNMKKIFLQLRCSNVLLHWKYILLLCEEKFNLINLPGGKALATDHRG